MSLATLAFDRESVRTYDRDGRLHVAASHCSKATVNPYYGHEIPDHERLGLQPSKIYYLLRDPEELAKAVPTFNKLPILNKHVPVNARDQDSHQSKFVVGATGESAAFNAPYLDNSLVVWAGPAIAAIEAGEVKELSAGYYYDADMTPGTFEGLHYDGVMRNIVGNHIALVDSGRAGSDVVVGDRQIEGLPAVKSRTALMLNGALIALLAPRLAMDAKLDTAPLVKDVTRGNYRKSTADLAARVVRLATPKLAQDESLDADDVVKVIAAVQGSAPDADEDAIPDDPPAVDDDGDIVSRIVAMLKGKVDEDVLAEITKMGGGAPVPADATDEDLPPGDPDAPEKKPAMDAKAVQRLVTATRTQAVADMQAVRQAERDVLPLVGEIKVAMDSAAEVYRFALEQKGVDLTGVHPSAFGAMVAMITPAASPADKSPLALDRKARQDAGAQLVTLFPGATKLKVI